MNRESCEGRQSDLPPIIAITTLSILAVQGCREVCHLTLVVHWNAAGNKAQSEFHLKRCSVVVDDLELLGHLAACRDSGGGGRLQADLHCLGNGSLTGENTLHTASSSPHSYLEYEVLDGRAGEVVGEQEDVGGGWRGRGEGEHHLQPVFLVRREGGDVLGGGGGRSVGHAVQAVQQRVQTSVGD